MNTILMAAARGARTQAQFHNWSNGGQNWRDCPPDIATRIHPDDEHLRFGPISTALREQAIAPEYGGWPDVVTTIITVNCNAADALGYTYCKDELHRSLFLLILSEALSDEGL